MRSLPALALLSLSAAAGAFAATLLALGPSRAAAADPAPSGPPDFTSVVARCEGAVVHIQTYLTSARAVPEADDRNASDEFSGSGFVYSADGVIVTNRHIADGAAGILVHVKGRGWMPARTLGIDPVVDVAVLKVDATGLPTLAIGDPRRLRVGQWVLAAGSPYRLPRSFTAGIVSGLERSDVGTPNPYEDFIQTDAAMNPGSSGGPLLDLDGRVVGVDTAVLSRTLGSQGIGFSVPIDVVVPVVEAIRAGRRVARTTIGAFVRDATAREAIALPGGAGQVLTRFSSDSPARRAGLSEGDVIVSVDGVPTPSRGVLLRTIWGKSPGTVSTLGVWRRGSLSQVSVTLVDK